MNIDRDDEYATRYEMTEPTIDEQIKHQKELCDMHGSNPAMRRSILASLEKLAALDSQPVPVEPVAYRRRNAWGTEWLYGDAQKGVTPLGYDAVYDQSAIDTLLSRLQVVQQNEKVWRAEWQQVSETAKALLERAEQAEKDRDACYASLEATRSKLHEITAFVNDNASPQRESEQERDAFARAIRERSAK